MSTHHRPGRSRRVAATGLALALVLGACGSSGTDVETDAVAGAVDDVLEPPATTAPIDTEAPPADATGSGRDEPADDQPGMVDEHPELDDAEPGGSGQAVEPDRVEPDSADTDPDEVAAPAPVAVELPSLTVVDLISGETVDLATVAGPGPTLVWFWAPH